MGTTTPKILIVEDAKNWAQTHKFMLGNHDITDIVAVDNVDTALKWMDENRGGIVLTDSLGNLWRDIIEKGKSLGMRTIVISAQSERNEPKFKEEVISLGGEFLSKTVFSNADLSGEAYKNLAESLKGNVGGSIEASGR